MSDIKLVVFDVGGVFVRTGRTWPEDAALAGFHFDEEWLRRFDERRVGFPRLSQGEVQPQKYFELLASISEGALTAEDVRRITAASLIEEYPGAATVFDALEGKPVETALLMNLNEVEWDRYFPAEVPSDFPAVGRAKHRFASHLIGANEPARRVYEHVEQHTGYSGDQILFFDDRGENVAAARELGWRAEIIDYEGDAPGQVLTCLRLYEVI